MARGRGVGGVSVAGAGGHGLSSLNPPKSSQSGKCTASSIFHTVSQPWSKVPASDEGISVSHRFSSLATD